MSQNEKGLIKIKGMSRQTRLKGDIKKGLKVCELWLVQFRYICSSKNLSKLFLSQFFGKSGATSISN